ncbi:hypothetical protein OA801_22645 [Citrobacter portucalensis]|uniref:hypothetical protein n=1 Tax=Citrobacter freundii complex TaxID=1344959 RepID=UPI001BCB6548|nr:MULTISPECIES: hypothetical protein [Citrobacter]HEE9875963.1 hypothetical protein [Citrobacter braakii]EKY0314765.1 hypothetical protein [Citrobacter freundii]MCR3717796.1 hypothetical protein [Citrobacter freundii]MCU6185702.1 hypothetical protein [Citrobacter cronae]MDN4361285.1 hypothetical protein [Citrobacter portucalensis]
MGTKTIWDGKDLPPIGCQVLIDLSSVGMRPYEVTGYEVRRSVNEVQYPAWLYVVKIKVKSSDGKSTNERFLNEVFPLDWRED